MNPMSFPCFAFFTRKLPADHNMSDSTHTLNLHPRRSIKCFMFIKPVRCLRPGMITTIATNIDSRTKSREQLRLDKIGHHEICHVLTESITCLQNLSRVKEKHIDICTVEKTNSREKVN